MGKYFNMYELSYLKNKISESSEYNTFDDQNYMLETILFLNSGDSNKEFYEQISESKDSTKVDIDNDGIKYTSIWVIDNEKQTFSNNTDEIYSSNYFHNIFKSYENTYDERAKDIYENNEYLVLGIDKFSIMDSLLNLEEYSKEYFTKLQH